MTPTPEPRSETSPEPSPEPPDRTAEAVVLDARGQRCPLPVIRLGALLRDLPPGSMVLLLATDPAARTDVAAFARMRGHDLVAVEEVRDAQIPHTAYLVRRGV